LNDFESSVVPAIIASIVVFGAIFTLAFIAMVTRRRPQNHHHQSSSSPPLGVGCSPAIVGAMVDVIAPDPRGEIIQATLNGLASFVGHRRMSASRSELMG
jgi:hypothetical protein